MDEELYEAAMNAEFRTGPKTRFGKLNTSVWACALVKGQGKVPFDPAQHKPEDRRIAVELYLEPLPNARFQDTITRNMIAESKEWAKIVLPSLRELGTDLKRLEGKWVRVEEVPTGRTYESKGETKEATTFRFAAVYESESECQSASDALFQGKGTSGGVSANGSGAGASPSALSKESARGFLDTFWKLSQGDVSKFLAQLAATPEVVAHFPPDSAEVMALVSAKAA